MDLPSLRIVITPTASQAEGGHSYQIDWAEEGGQSATRLAGSVIALGPDTLADNDEGLIRVCAWLAAVALDGEASESNMGLALVRMDERSDLPMELTKTVELATVEVRGSTGEQWIREWPYAYELETLLDQGCPEHLARRLGQALSAPTTRPQRRF